MKQRILIVDDNELVLTMARDALEEAGYEVQTAMDGVQANNYIFSKKRPDLMLFDVMLPMLNGDRKVKLLKEKEMGKQVPILLMSAKEERELARLASDAGADGFIAKPFTQQGLVASIRSALTSAALKPAV